jgi:hypothetical protein
MSKARKSREAVADFFAFSKFGMPVFIIAMLLVFGVGGGLLVSLVQ